jgi:hypothetical protein
MYLHILSDGSRMRLLSIAAASLNLSRLAGDAHRSSGWENRLRIGGGLLSWRVHRKAFSQIVKETEL